MTEAVCYQIVVSDGGTDLYTYSIPSSDTISNAIYTNYNTARDALKDMAESIETFTPVAYGQAFPYENLTFEQVLYEKGYATFGWLRIEDEESGDIVKVAIGLLRLNLNMSKN